MAVRTFILMVALPAVVLTAGCLSEDARTTRAINSISAGDGSAAVVWAQNMAEKSSYSRTLGAVELGRTQMLSGNFDKSLHAFNFAIDAAMDRRDCQPVIKLGDVGNTVLASTITDDRTRNYYLPPYELNLALQYVILNDLFLGRREDAQVDARAAVHAQNYLADTYSATVAKSSKVGAGKNKALAANIVKSASSRMSDILSRTRDSWENAALWWLTGLIFESSGDMSDAAVSYRKAYELVPLNPILAADCSRLADAMNSTVPPQQSNSSATQQAEIVVFFDESFVSRRKAIKVVVPVYTTVGVDIPLYNDEPYNPSTLTLSGIANGKLWPALDVQSLAYRDLKEKMPGIVTRAVTRAATQIAAQYGANVVADNQSNASAALAIRLGVLTANAILSAVRNADTRTWATLPMNTQIFREKCNAGSGSLTITVGGNSDTSIIKNSLMSVPLTLAPGETRLVYVADVGGSTRIVTATLSGSGASAEFMIGPALVGPRKASSKKASK